MCVRVCVCCVNVLCVRACVCVCVWVDNPRQHREEGVGARAMDTHNFSMGPLPDYMEREFGALGSLSQKSVVCDSLDERY